MLYYSLHAFDLLSEISSLVVAAPAESLEKFRREIKAWGFSKPVQVVAGGAIRSGSVLNTLRALAGAAPDMVMIHDAARACVTAEMIKILLKEGSDGTAATLAHPAADTLREIDAGKIAKELDRAEIAALETPQMFPFARILDLHENSQGQELPDDTSLFTRAGLPVKVVFHDGINMKITYPEDIPAAEGILFGRGWQDASEGEE
jgi:2-C-methyl-D-erythritol 4-phosphate cytidylyltransferase